MRTRPTRKRATRRGSAGRDCWRSSNTASAGAKHGEAWNGNLSPRTDLGWDRSGYRSGLARQLVWDGRKPPAPADYRPARPCLEERPEVSLAEGAVQAAQGGRAALDTSGAHERQRGRED